MLERICEHWSTRSIKDISAEECFFKLPVYRSAGLKLAPYSWALLLYICSWGCTKPHQGSTFLLVSASLADASYTNFFNFLRFLDVQQWPSIIRFSRSSISSPCANSECPYLHASSSFSSSRPPPCQSASQPYLPRVQAPSQEREATLNVHLSVRV